MFTSLHVSHPNCVFVVLDEATSQVSLEMEERLYGLCRLLGITVLSVGHRDSLRQFHDKVLRLDGRGGWTLEDIDLAS